MLWITFKCLHLCLCCPLHRHTHLHPLAETMEVNVALHRKEKQPLGIFFRCLSTPPYCQVAKLLDSGAAMASNEVHIGDILLNINEKDVQSLTPEDVKDVLKACSADMPVRLKLQRTLTNGAPLSNGPSDSQDEAEVTEPKSSPRRSRRVGLAVPLPSIEEGAPPGKPRPRLSFTPETNSKKEEYPKLAASKSVDLHSLPQWRRQMSQMVSLQNLLDGHEMTDRLHNRCRDLRVRGGRREERGEKGGGRREERGRRKERGGRKGERREKRGGRREEGGRREKREGGGRPGWCGVLRF